MVKPTGTSAATTVFCATKVEGPDGFLWIDGNGKITAANGTLEDPKPNAFSLVEIADCPDSTSICRRACYVHGIAKYAPHIHGLYEHNSREVRRFLPIPGLSSDWASVFARWIGENCRGGFRWHVSGDVFSDQYAQWVALVCRRSSSVNHWIYTRSFKSISFLIEAPNLVINLSADNENFIGALNAAEQYGKRICYIATDGTVPDGLPDGSVIFPDYSLRGGNLKGQQWFELLSPQYKSFVCPVDYHGKDENRRCGPCTRCLK
jgi:hypothetical protein